jgi:site-specific recombinase XerD
MGLTLEGAVGLFMTAMKAEGLKPETLTWYQHRLRRFVETNGKLEVTEITLEDVREYMAWVQESEYSAHTRFTLVRVVRRLFKWLFEERKIDDNFYRRIKLPKLPQPTPKAIEMAEVRAILACCGDNRGGLRDRAIVLFLLDTGCRVGGLCRLKVSDLDFEHLRASLFEKGEKARMALFGAKTAEALAAWMNARPFPGVEAVFTSLREPRALTPNGVIQLLKRYKKRAGLHGRINPHAFRHAFAREYILNGGDLASVSEMMGHTQIAVTKQFYAVFQAEELREKHDRFSPVSRLAG